MGEGSPVPSAGKHAVLKSVQSVQIFILGSSDIIQLSPSPRCGWEWGVAVSALCCLGWDPGFLTLRTCVSTLSLSLPGIRSSPPWPYMFVASSRHRPRFALLLSCSLSSYSLTCWGRLLEMGSGICGWYQHGGVRAGEGTSRVGLSQDEYPSSSSPADPFLS